MQAVLTRTMVEQAKKRLSPNENRVLEGLIAHRDTREIAEELRLREQTVRSYRSTVLSALGLKEGTVEERLELLRQIMRAKRGPYRTRASPSQPDQKTDGEDVLSVPAEADTETAIIAHSIALSDPDTIIDVRVIRSLDGFYHNFGNWARDGYHAEKVIVFQSFKEPFKSISQAVLVRRKRA